MENLKVYIRLFRQGCFEKRICMSPNFSLLLAGLYIYFQLSFLFNHSYLIYPSFSFSFIYIFLYIGKTDTAISLFQIISLRTQEGSGNGGSMIELTEQTLIEEEMFSDLLRMRMSTPIQLRNLLLKILNT